MDVGLECGQFPVGITEAEPKYTLYTQDWADARKRISVLVSERQRGTFSALLDHLEVGWAIIRPLQQEADRIAEREAFPWTAAAEVAAFVECDPADLYRVVAQSCCAAVPGASHCIGHFSAEDVRCESEQTVRYVRLLRLASAHPEFPPELLDVIGDVCAALERWLDELPSVVGPVDSLVERVDAGEAAIRFSPSAVRVLR
ncbi:MAG TPA: hypothetical protein VFJ16_10665 [Longimicrobium sp.]|nr:hypothetical protein [Longimicrobium sp.]